jgi:hypothetical protein
MKFPILKSRVSFYTFCLLVASLLFVVTIAEATVRLLDLAPYRIFYWTTNIRHKKIEHCAKGFCVTYTLNNQGLRSDRDYGPKPPGTLRIVMVGDSFTFGWGVEDHETIPAYVQQTLALSLPSHQIEVINLGVPGTNPHRFLRYVNQYAKFLEADIVIQNLFEVRNTYFGLNPVVYEDLKREQLDQWIVQSQKTDPDPEAEKQQKIYWQLGLFRLAYRAWLKYGNGVDYRTFNVDWGGPEATSAMQPGPIEAEECTRQKQITQLCSNNFNLPTEWGDRSKQAQLQLIDKFRKSGIIFDACNCALPPQFVTMMLQNALVPSDATMLNSDTRPQIIAGVKLAVAATAANATAAHDFGAGFLAVIFPNYFRFVERDPRHFLDHVMLWDDQLLKSTRLTDHIITLCREFALYCVNGVEPLKVFAQGKAADELVLPDSHFTALTNREFANLIVLALRERFKQLQ